MVLLASAALTVPAQGAEVALNAVRAQTPPGINGILDDSVWAETPSIEGFFSERYGRPISERTTAWVAYDEACVYAAFYCYCDPEKIRAFQQKRGGSFSLDDYVSLKLDTFCSSGKMYEFYVNPLGTQDESVLGGSAANVRWRGDWQAAARIVDDGWIAEMAVPLSILRYPEGQSEFQVSLSRTIQETLETGYWPPEAYMSDARGACLWKGLKLPSPKRPWYVMPYAAIDWREGEADAYAGLDVKKSFANGLSLVLTYNPDFRNIEGDVLGLDFSYAEKVVAETRPFFLEGSGYFPSKTFFYPQRVEEIDVAGKLLGRVGDTSIGFLDAVSPNSRNDAVLSLEHDLSDVFQVRADAVSRTEPDLSNTAVNFELSARQIRSSYEYAATGSYGFTETTGDDGDGHIASVILSRSPGGPGLSLGMTLEEISPDFNPVNGFVPDKDVRGARGYAGYSQAFDEGKLECWNAYVDVRQYNRTNGDFFHRDTEVRLGVDVRDRLGFDFGFFDSNRSVPEKTHNDTLGYLGVQWNRHSYRRAGGLSVLSGRKASQDYLLATLDQEFLLSDRLSCSARAQHRVLRGDTTDEQSQGVFSFNYDFTPEIGVSGRLVATQDDVNGYLAFKQRTRKGLDLFVAIGDPNAEEFTERVAVKLSVCLEI